MRQRRLEYENFVLSLTAAICKYIEEKKERDEGNMRYNLKLHRLAGIMLACAMLLQLIPGGTIHLLHHIPVSAAHSYFLS